ncbi:MAG: hypothetical protein ACRD5E_12500 [Nitrososphaeraceae archaeon]
MFPCESFRDGIEMVETNDLEPGIPEDKLYAHGFGHVADNK